MADSYPDVTAKDRKALEKRVTARLKAKDLDAKAAEERAEVPRGTLARLYSGNKKLTPDVLDAIAGALDVASRDLVADTAWEALLPAQPAPKTEAAAPKKEAPPPKAKAPPAKEAPAPKKEAARAEEAGAPAPNVTPVRTVPTPPQTEQAGGAPAPEERVQDRPPTVEPQATTTQRPAVEPSGQEREAAENGRRGVFGSIVDKVVGLLRRRR